MPMTMSGTSGITNPSGFTSNATNGYTKLPDGTILQWGTVASVAPGAGTTVTFPIAFPTACLNVTATPIWTSGSTSSANSSTTYARILSTTQVLIQTGGGDTLNRFWFAIGY